MSRTIADLQCNKCGFVTVMYLCGNKSFRQQLMETVCYWCRADWRELKLIHHDDSHDKQCSSGNPFEDDMYLDGD